MLPWERQVVVYQVMEALENEKNQGSDNMFEEGFNG
tara:strand:- start:448 stop:555 length:108 start_codon:yes stop_codon:yes gene_type:complete